jgi:hypothetical protein
MPTESKDGHKRYVFDYSSFVRPCPGERMSGDAVFVDQRNGTVFLAIVDVLGHGNEAHAVAQHAKTFLKAHWKADISQTLLALHEEIKGTRGAVVGLCAVDLEDGCLRYVGIGNTAIRKLGRKMERFQSSAGTVGRDIRMPAEQLFQLRVGDVLLLYTDGVQDRFELKDYPDIMTDDTWTIARQVVRKFGKQFDDAACLAARIEK